MPVMNYLENSGEDFAILVLPDHPTPVETGTHSKGAVPFFAYSNKFPKISKAYSEENANQTGIVIQNGHELMKLFLDLTIFL